MARSLKSFQFFLCLLCLAAIAGVAVQLPVQQIAGTLDNVIGFVAAETPHQI